MRLAWVAGVAALVIGGAGAAPALAGDGTFPDSAARTVDALDQPNDLAVGDFNNDGRQDLVVASEDETDDYRVALGAGDGSFTPLPAVNDATNTTEENSILVADLTGDGNEDLVIGGQDAQEFNVYRGNGDGTFGRLGTPYQLSADPANSTAIEFAHLDGSADAATDLVAVADTAGTDVLRIFQGNTTSGVPNGSFGPPATVSLSNTAPRDLATADFNGDGSEDVAVALVGSDRVGVYTGNSSGAGTLTSHQVAVDPVALAVGDFDRNGAEDIVAASSGRLSILLGRGNGTFAPYLDLPSNDDDAVAVGDFNSDGFEDIVTTSRGFPDTFSIFAGAGDGTFAASTQVLPSSGPEAVVVGDFNRDGNEDLALANQARDTLTVRDGAGPPADEQNLLTNGGGEAAAGSTAARVFATQMPAVPGWISSGPLTNVRYDASDGFLTRKASSRWGGQEAFFAGGSAASSSASQTVDVSGSAASIDAGLASVRLSGYLGGYRTDGDAMTVTAAFADGSAQPLGSPLQIGPVTPADRHNLTTLLRRTADASVPAGTRSITVMVAAQRTTGVYSDGYADRLGLFLTAPDPPTNPPPPTDSADRTAPETTITKEPKANSSKAKAKYKFTSSEPNSTFECKLDKGKFKPCDAGKVKYKRLDFGKHKFAVVATDAAGNTDATPDKDKFKRKR